MAEFKRKDKNHFWYSPIVLSVLFLFFLISLYRISILYKKERETQEKKNQAMGQLDSLKSREESLSKDIANLNTTEGVESVIREKYQVAKEGEKMVIIVDEKKKNDETPTEKSHGFWNWVKGIFSSK